MESTPEVWLPNAERGVTKTEFQQWAKL